MERHGNVVNGTLNQSAGKAQQAQSLSLSSFFASLSVSFAVLGIGFTLFILLKDRCKRIYQPRVYGLSHHKVTALRPGPIAWIRPFLRLSDDDILGLCGIDSYLFLRYLRTMVLICGPLSIVVVPPLLSLNLTNARRSLGWARGMDQFSWSNMSVADQTHLWGHFCCAICIMSYSCFVLHSELKFYLRLLQKQKRQKPAVSSSLHLVLLTDIPEGMKSETELRKFFSLKIPFAIQYIEFLHNVGLLSDTMKKRKDKHTKLEKTETRLIQKALATKKISDKEKKEVCTLCKELAELNGQIERKQQRSHSGESTAILGFPSKFMAQAFENSIAQPFAKCMLPHYLGKSTEDIIWANLGSTWWERQLRSLLTSVLSICLVLGWTIPISFTGVLSQLSYLAELLPWLSWVNSLPVWFAAFLQGVLPQIALSILMLIFPNILRATIKQKRLFTKTAVELSLQSYYFAFLFIHLFLTVSISSGIITVLAELLDRPKLGPVILARNLPKASNYFISNILFQAFLHSSLVFGQLVRNFSCVLSKTMCTTPREQAAKVYNLSPMNWGTFFPVYTNMSCIMIAFSAIAPIILVIGSIAFAILWAAHRYSCVYVNKPESDNGGRLYPAALLQLFTGLYVLQLCLIGLYALSQNTHGNRDWIPLVGMMALALVCTVFYNRKLVEVYCPLFSGKVMEDVSEELALASWQSKDQAQKSILRAEHPVVWIPQDSSRVSRREVREIRKYGIPISNEGAVLNGKGKIVCQILVPPESGFRR